MTLEDFMTPKTTQYFTGRFWEKYPTPTIDGLNIGNSEDFTYEIVSERNKEYKTILGNMENDGASLTIKTRNKLKFNIKGYIKCQDDELYQIVSIAKKPVEENYEASRLFNEQINEYVIRLINVDNPMEIQ